MTDKLARLRSRVRDAKPIHDIVEPPLKQSQEVDARVPALPDRVVNVPAKLPFARAIHEFGFLLLHHLTPIRRHAGALRRSMRARRLFQPPRDLCRIGLQTQIHPKPSGYFISWSCVSSHKNLRITDNPDLLIAHNSGLPTTQYV